MSFEEVFIVGGGPSLTGFDFTRLGGHTTIAVNHALFDDPDPDYFITMDYLWLQKSGIQGGGNLDPANHSWFTRSQAQKIFVMGLSQPRLKTIDYHHYYDNELKREYDLSLFDNIIIASQYGGMGTHMSDFHCASDSGYAAIQLAVAMGFKKIYLLGLDFVIDRSSTHYRTDCRTHDLEGYQEKLNLFLDAYIQAFVDIHAKTNIEVISLSKISRLNAYIPYQDIDEVLK
jgi:hypothetical protein